MYSLFRSLEEIGSISLNEIWLPILIWTILASGILALLNLKKNLNPLYHYHLRIATILALPAGILLSQIFLNVLRYILRVEESELLFTITNPLEIGDADFVVNQAINLQSPLFWIGLISLVFALVSSLFIIRVAYSLFKLNQIRRNLDFTLLNNLPELNGENCDIISRIKEDVHIAFSKDYSSPFTFGWNQPVIVIPELLKEDEEALNLIIAHELIHIRRKDYHIHLVVSLISAVFSFHPLFSFVKRQINDFREISCDQEVLTEFQASPKTYAKLIFSLMQKPDHGHTLQVSLAQYNSNLKKRISTMKYHSLYRSSYKKSVSFIALLSVAIMLPIACTEMSSESIETPEDSFKTAPATESPNLKLYDSDEYVLNLDGEEVTYEELEKALTTEMIGSINVDKTDSGKKVVNVVSKNYGEKLPPPPPRAVKKNSFVTEEDVFTVVEEMPEIKGGLSAIANEVIYPTQARKAGIEGRVIVTFVVTKEGNVRNAQVVRGIGAGCDEEALRVVENAKFEPGKQHGRNVDVQFTLPIVFKLDK